MILASIFIAFFVTSFLLVFAFLKNVGNSLFFAGIVMIFFAVAFLLAYALLKRVKPSIEKKKKKFIEQIKNTISIHKRFMRIKYIEKKVTALWVEMGKPNYPLPEDIVVIKQLVALGLFIMSWIIGLKIVAPFLAVAGFFLSDFYFKKQAQARLKEIEKRFPSAIDLLTLCLEAGIDFIAAIAKIIENSEPSPLRDEFQEITRELQLGASRREAMEHFGKRCESIEQVSSFVSLIVQAEALGTSLVSVLRDYSDDMRLKRWQDAEKKALEAPTKMLFPMVIFIFPGIFILIFTPVVLQVIAMF